MEFEKRPLDEKIDLEPKVEHHGDLGFDRIEADLKGAIQAVGEDEVAAALAQVATGQARPEELLAWIDELRDPELESHAQEETPLGFLHDFEADTEIAAGETEAKADTVDADEAVADQVGSGSGGGFAEDDDAHYLFSAVR